MPAELRAKAGRALVEAMLRFGEKCPVYLAGGMHLLFDAETCARTTRGKSVTIGGQVWFGYGSAMRCRAWTRER